MHLFNHFLHMWFGRIRNLIVYVRNLEEATLEEFKVNEAATSKSLLQFQFFLPHFTFHYETLKQGLQNLCNFIFCLRSEFPVTGVPELSWR